MIEAPTIGATLSGGHHGDDYELVRLLGAGGMGNVYEARTSAGDRVAVKVLLESFQSMDDVRVRFDREGRLTSSLASRHLVPSIDTGVDERTGAVFIVMPMLVGLDVDELCERLGPLHPTLAARIVRQVCRGLAEAHDLGIVHRDIKPSNIFLHHTTDGEVVARLMDLGIAKWRAESGDLTRTGSVVGTPYYMAPEQVRDSKRVSPQTDVWSLGVTLYEMLTGFQPFNAWTELAEVWIAISSVDADPVQDHAPWIDPALAEIVHGTMIRDLALRCPDADALHDALEPFVDDDDVLTPGMLTPMSAAVLMRRAPKAEQPTAWTMARPTHTPPPLQDEDDDPLLHQTLDGRFELVRCLGSGAMGAVYEALTESGGRSAVKVIRPELAGTSRVVRRRFVREAQVAKTLRSPYVVKVHEVASDPAHDVPFIVMELMAGRDLERAIKTHGALPPKVVARLFFQAAQGLVAAHEMGFAHRDVKPANLFLALQPNGAVRMKVCDFGLAKRVESDVVTATTAGLTRAGNIVGSPMYMSPEQARNEADLDHRSDIWSLGATMYEALAGEPPWPRDASLPELILAVSQGEVPLIQDRAPWVPAALATIVHSAMQRDPELRFASMQEMAEALLEVAGDPDIVLAEDIAPIAADVRIRRAPRAEFAAAEATSERPSKEPPIEQPPRRRASRVLALGLAAGLGLLAANLPRSAAPAQRGHVVPRVPRPISAGRPGTTSQTILAHLSVRPASATVTIDGQTAAPNGEGVFVLRGRAGDSFGVVAAWRERRVRKEVVLRRDGDNAVSIDLSSRAAPSPAPPSKTTAPAAPPPPTRRPGMSARDDW